MMNWKTFAVATGTLIILPLSTYAAKSHQQVNNIQEENNMISVAHRVKHGKGRRGQRIGKLLQKLDLTPEQSQQIETIREQSKTTAQETKEQLQAQRQEMKSLFSSNATTEQIRQRHQETQSLHQQLGNNHFETMLQIREILTEEQREQISELMEQHRGRRMR